MTEPGQPRDFWASWATNLYLSLSIPDEQVFRMYMSFCALTPFPDACRSSLTVTFSERISRRLIPG